MPKSVCTSIDFGYFRLSSSTATAPINSQRTTSYLCSIMTLGLGYKPLKSPDRNLHQQEEQCREVFDQMITIIYTEKMHQTVCLADGPVGKNQTTIRLMNHTAGAAMFTGVRCSQLGAPISRCHSSFIINWCKETCLCTK